MRIRHFAISTNHEKHNMVRNLNLRPIASDPSRQVSMKVFNITPNINQKCIKIKGLVWTCLNISENPNSSLHLTRRTPWLTKFHFAKRQERKPDRRIKPAFGRLGQMAIIKPAKPSSMNLYSSQPPFSNLGREQQEGNTASPPGSRDKWYP